MIVNECRIRFRGFVYEKINFERLRTEPGRRVCRCTLFLLVTMFVNVNGGVALTVLACSNQLEHSSDRRKTDNTVASSIFPNIEASRNNEQRSGTLVACRMNVQIQFSRKRSFPRQNFVPHILFITTGTFAQFSAMPRIFNRSVFISSFIFDSFL